MIWLFPPQVCFFLPQIRERQTQEHLPHPPKDLYAAVYSQLVPGHGHIHMPSVFMEVSGHEARTFACGSALLSIMLLLCHCPAHMADVSDGSFGFNGILGLPDP